MGRECIIARESAEEIGKRLVLLRNEIGLTQNEVCERTGLDRTLLAQLESGSREPDVHAWITLATFYEVSTDYIAGTSFQRTFKGHSISDKMDLDKLNEKGKHILFDCYHRLIECKETSK